MDVKEEDKSEESKKNHISYYKSLTKVISNIQEEMSVGIDPTMKNHLDERLDALEICFQTLLRMNGMVTPTEKNHNKYLDLLHDYKMHLVEYIQVLEKMDKQSEFAKKWNETAIKERKEELQVIDRILKNLIRF
jgi:hypothetical protein